MIALPRLVGFVCLLLAACLTVSCGEGDDDDSGSAPTDDDASGDDDDDNDDDNDDNDASPSPPPLTGPLHWGRYVCGDARADDTLVATGNFNLHGGAEATADAVAAGIAAHGPFDVLTLQEAPDEYVPAVAAALGMDSFAYGALALLSATPLVGAAGFDLLEGRTVVHATTTIDGVEFSLYAIHISWVEAGAAQARQLVDEFLADDPVERLIMSGDWNDETGSVQMSIMNETTAEAWASLGVWPSARITWPAQLFYGGEGAQLIDNTLFNKSSGACAVDGEIVNFTPPLSDHKLQKSTLSFPSEPAPQPPHLLDVLPGFGDDAIGLLFDKPMAAATVELTVGGTPLPVSDVQVLAEGEIVLVRAASALPFDQTTTVRVAAATDVDGNVLPTPAQRAFVARANLLRDGGAEEGGDGWELDAMRTAADYYEVTPLAGAAFFTGTDGHKRGWAKQTADLTDHAADIDAGLARIVFAGAARTGYLTTPNGSNVLQPYDEGEALVDLLDADGKVLRTVSSGRFDTLYWQPWRAIAEIPPATRAARVTLRAVGGLDGWTFNSAAFDALHLAVEVGSSPHTLLGGNLLLDPDFGAGLDHWDHEGFVIAGRDRWFSGNFDVNSFSGEYWVGGVPLTSVWFEQTVELPEYGEAIDNGAFALRWGAALRSLLGYAGGSLILTYSDDHNTPLGSTSLGPIRCAEWFSYEATTPAPIGARRAALHWATDSGGMALDCSFVDAPFVYPVRADAR